jgi:TrmH family RNA methyltransferase
MPVNLIASVQNQRVKDVVKLRDHRQRAKQGRFLIDGAREILLAMSGRVRLVEVFVCEPLCTTAESRQVLERLDDTRADIWEVTPEVFEKMAFGERHEGVLAIGKAAPLTLAELEVPRGGLIAVVEGLEKPGNVGAILRSADAAGVAAVIVADPRTDLYNPNCIRASLGTIFSKPVCQATSQAALSWLRERGCRIFAARLNAKLSYSEADFRGEVAIVLGSEAAGLTAAWQTADVTAIAVPMHGAADSLNVSAAAAVLFYEALRQRAAQACR